MRGLEPLGDFKSDIVFGGCQMGLHKTFTKTSLANHGLISADCARCSGGCGAGVNATSRSRT